jgi:hypothetical protein
VSKKDIFFNQIFSLVRYYKLKAKDPYTSYIINCKKAVLAQLLLKESRVQVNFEDYNRYSTGNSSHLINCNYSRFEKENYLRFYYSWAEVFAFNRSESEKVLGSLKRLSEDYQFWGPYFDSFYLGEKVKFFC